MLVLVAGERILLQREAKITIRYKGYKGKEKGKGTLYITNLRIAFEDSRKGILLQVFPAQYELQAYRISKGLLGGEKLMLDIEKRVEGKSLFATAEVEVEGKDSKKIMKGVEEALQTLLNSSSIMTTVSSSSSSIANYSIDMHKYSESNNNKDKECYEVLSIDLYKDDKLQRLYHDVDAQAFYVFAGEEYWEGKKVKVIVTRYKAYIITPEGAIYLIGPKDEMKVWREGNVAHVQADKDIGPVKGRRFKIFFKSEEEAEEFVKLYNSLIEVRRNDKMIKGRYSWEQLRIGEVRVKTMVNEDPEIIIYPQPIPRK
ncbi:MAG: hypothetical protein QW416_09245 [Candidatus Nitrosocaldaceae archaeon]